ncbi:MAG: hypothetical protein OHK0040_03860 [bacterium]
MKLKTALFVLFVLMLTGCATKKAPTPEKAFEEAMSLYSLKNYEDSVEAFKKVKELFPDHKLAKNAQLLIGDANFKSEKYEEAVIAYDDFAKLYPEDINVPYARYMEAMSYYQRISEKDRDQSFTRQSADKFYSIIKTFPDTPYAVKSYEYLKDCRKRLAEQEIFVANFYLRYDKFKAAEKRFHYALNNFPDVDIQEEALVGLYKLYKKQKNEEKAKAIFETLLFYFPNSSYRNKLPK